MTAAAQTPAPGEDPNPLQSGSGRDGGHGDGAQQPAPSPCSPALTRSPAEIAARVEALMQPGTSDWMGNRREVLLGYLDYERAKPWLKADATAESWDGARDNPAIIGEASAAYLEFAFGKARAHRGLSAVRSVEKLAEWAWLMGHDDLHEQMHADANFPQYGVPALVLFARRFELPVPDGDDLARMAAGEPCEPGCDGGCGR